VDWIIVKAICDWADGHKSRNKDRRQASAAEQAVSFVLLALRQGGFLTMHEA
jgi:nucleoside phosphorylase